MIQTQQSSEKKVSMSDIARAANVSLTTVSMVLGKRKTALSISKERSAQIKKIARELGYKPNVFASRLAANRSRLHQLAVVMPSEVMLQGSIGASTSRVICGLTEAASAAGYTCTFLMPQGEPGKAFIKNPLFQERLIEGVVALGWEKVEECYLEECVDVGIPMVGVHVGAINHSIPSIAPDDFENGFIAADHLCGLGHKRIAFIGGPMDSDPANDRKAGVRARLKKSGLMLSEDTIVPGDYWDFDQENFEKLFKSKNRPTAAVCVSDRLAAKAMVELKDMGLKVPKDVSVVGFDDAEFTSFLTPKLTTVKIDGLAEGKKACEVILGLIHGQKKSEPILKTPGELVVRESTRSYPKNIIN